MGGGLPLNDPGQPFAEDIPGDADCEMFLETLGAAQKETGTYDAWSATRSIQQHKRRR